MGEQNITLGTIIAYIESSNNPWAIRFEARLFLKDFHSSNAQKIMARIATINKCTLTTAKMIYCTSWGKYQIMGFNLYNDYTCNYDNPIAEYLFAPEHQDDSFHAFCGRAAQVLEKTPQQLLDDSTRKQFALKYNGSALYADRLKDALDHFGITA